jgi:hypothetical protein
MLPSLDKQRPPPFTHSQSPPKSARYCPLVFSDSLESAAHLLPLLAEPPGAQVQAAGGPATSPIQLPRLAATMPR